MRELERIYKAVANRRRLAILKYLKQNGEAPVGEIAHEINLSFKATSKHLGKLDECNILEREQRSSQMFYRLASSQKPPVRHVITLL
jgi:DNA-binding transcriptional ArsR family regulator